MKLNIHQQNLELVRDCLNSGYPEVWLHGSGDIFPVYVHNPLEPDKQDHSKNHAENFNRGFEQNGYRVKINKSNLPKNVKEAEMMLMQAKNMEDAQKEQTKQNPNARVTNIRVTDTSLAGDIHEPAGEIDYSKFTKK